MPEQGVPQAELKEAIALAEERTGQVANEKLFAEILEAAYPAIREQVLGEVREALAAEFEKRGTHHANVARKLELEGRDEFNGGDLGAERAYFDAAAHALATLTPSEATTGECPSCGATHPASNVQEVTGGGMRGFHWCRDAFHDQPSERSGAPLPEAERPLTEAELLRMFEATDSARLAREEREG